jgi:hypothetical protein
VLKNLERICEKMLKGEVLECLVRVNKFINNGGPQYK